MNKEPETQKILQDIDNQKNPDAWIDRIKRLLGPLRINQETLVHPCVIDGQQTLVYERGLKERNCTAYQDVVDFAEAADFRLKEDQRAKFIEGVKRVKNKHRANVVSIMALTAAFLSPNVVANSTPVADDSNTSHNVLQSQNTAGYDLNIDSNTSHDELVTELLAWINTHSSFTHRLDNMPDIVKVSADKLAEVAFGEELPKTLNTEKLKIYGLYNFNENAVYILNSIDLASEVGKAILLHELVQFLQYQYGTDEDVKYKNDLEILSYLLQAQYLYAHNYSPKSSMDHINRVRQ